MSEATHYILDSFALLAYLQNEPGAGRVRDVLHAAQDQKCRASMSLINLGETAYIIERERGLAKTQQALAAIQQLPIAILPADQEAVLAAAHIKAHHRISFADAFAAAAAMTHQAVLLTGDPEFKALQAAVSIEWIG